MPSFSLQSFHLYYILFMMFQVYTLVGLYLGLSLIALTLVAFFLDRLELERDADRPRCTAVSFTASLKQVLLHWLLLFYHCGEWATWCSGYDVDRKGTISNPTCCSIGNSKQVYTYCHTLLILCLCRVSVGSKCTTTSVRM